MTFQTILRSSAGLICSVLLIMGCAEEAESPHAPKSVRQKIDIVEKKESQSIKVLPIESPTVQKGTEKPSTDVVESSEGKTAAPKPAFEVSPPAPVDRSIEDTQASSSQLTTVTQADSGRVDRATEGKIDPFVPLFRDEPMATGKIESTREIKRRIPLTPLEKIDLGQLKLVAIVQASSGDRALVEESSGKGYIITKGTYIGIHAGRVIEILKDAVIVEEEVEDVLGKVTISRKELKLQKPPGEF